MKSTSSVGDGGDFGAVEEAVGDDVVDLAGLGAEDAGEMGGLLAGEGGVGGVAGGGDQVSAMKRRRHRGQVEVLRCRVARRSRAMGRWVWRMGTVMASWW